MSLGVLEDFLVVLRDAAKKYGPLAGILLLVCSMYVWRDWQREASLVGRIDRLESEMRQVVFPLVKECTEVVARNTDALNRNTAVMERLDNASRP